MSDPVRLKDLIATSHAVRDSRGRNEKTAHLRALFERLEPDELRLATSYLAGEIPQGCLNVGWRALTRVLQAPAEITPTLFESQQPPRERASPTLHELDTIFHALRSSSGAGAARQREGLLRELLPALAQEEADFLQALILGELRQGALRAVVLDAVASTLRVDLDALRRAVMFAGVLGEVVEAIAREGPVACTRFGPRPLVPIEPMLAATAPDLEAALQRMNMHAAVESKLDGVRAQVHRMQKEVRIYTRRLRDVTHLVPAVVQQIRTLTVTSLILDGEIIGLDTAGRPLAFQDLMSHFSRQRPEKRSRGGAIPQLFQAQSAPGAGSAPRVVHSRVDASPTVRLLPLFFDLLHLDGESLVDRTYLERRRILEGLLPTENIVPQRMVSNPAAAREAYDASLAAGHEGVLVKALDLPYVGGRRGAAWLKVKPAITLDLVILAAEWGHGRRQGFLSNLHLGARDSRDPQRFHMLGKTFKGLTDRMLEEMSADLLDLEVRREGHIVHVQPVRVVEIAFDSVQRSARYNSGLVLRFARVKRFRPDKEAEDANTLEDVRQFQRGLA